MELIKLLMDYEVRDQLLAGIVKLLKLSKEDLMNGPEILKGL